MTENAIKVNHQRIQAGVKAAIAQAIERHRKLGESIAIWKDGKVVILTADQIPTIQTERRLTENSLIEKDLFDAAEGAL